jgi:hypothetical protein
MLAAKIMEILRREKRSFHLIYHASNKKYFNRKNYKKKLKFQKLINQHHKGEDFYF